MSEPMPDWESIVGEVDKTATDFGHIAMLKDQGKLKRYLFLYEYEGDEGKTTIRVCWTKNEPLWALGAAMHARNHIDDGWDEIDGPEDD